MLYFIHPIDDSTEFLEQIYINAINELGNVHVTVFAFKGENEFRSEIESLPANSNIFFLGHGKSDRLYGVMSESNEAFVSSDEMSIFNGQNLFTLACQSSELLKSTFKKTEINHSIGFGYLPTTDEEVLKIRNMRNKNISSAEIEQFKSIIVSCVSESVIEMHCKNESFDYLNSYLRLLLHQEMNNSVLDQNESGVANLIYQMCYQMRYFRNQAI